MLPKKEVIVPQKDSLPTIDSLAKYYSYSSENINQENFEEVVYEIIQCYNKKDTTALNKLIHPDIGLYFLYKPGGDVYWANQKRIYLDTLYQEKEKTFIDGYNRKVLATGKIGVGKVPIEKITENIAPDEYSSLTGIFFVAHPEAQKKLSYYITSSLSTFPFSPKEKQEAQRTLKKAKEIEKTTRCIMTAWKEVSSFSNSTYTNHFIFYVTKINEKWYLTMIDFSWIA
ncbi:hypothetical protein ACUBIN_05255 [Capnocytophaga gingivalis]